MSKFMVEKKFSIGDKVRSTRTQEYNGSEDTKYLPAYSVGIVTHLDGVWLSVDNMLGVDGEPVFCPSAFELLEAAPKKQKKWLKATPELIAELKVGDKVKLRSGVKATITGVRFDSPPAFPIEHDCGDGGYMACDANGKNCLTQGKYKGSTDIVKVKNKEYVKENANKSS